MSVKRGTTSYTHPIFAQDTTSVIGGGKTGLLFSTSGLICYYKRELDSVSHVIALQTMTLGTWATGGFKEVDATHMPGAYDFGIPDAAISASDASKWVEFYFTGASGAFFAPIRIDLIAVDPQDASALGLSILSTISTNVSTALSRIGAFAGTGVNNVLGFFQALARSDASNPSDMGGTYDPATDSLQGINDSLATVGDVTDGVWDEPIASHLDPGSTGEALDTASSGGGDPLSNPVPNGYAVGTAGYNLGLISPGSITVVSPVSEEGDVETVAGMDYTVASGFPIDFTISGFPTFVGATCYAVLYNKNTQDVMATLTGTPLSATVLRFTPSAADLAALTVPVKELTFQYRFELKVILTGAAATVKPISVATGMWTVTRAAVSA